MYTLTWPAAVLAISNGGGACGVNTGRAQAVSELLSVTNVTVISFYPYSQSLFSFITHANFPLILFCLSFSIYIYMYVCPL